MNGKITYLSATKDRAIFFDRTYFTIGRTEESQLLVRSHTENPAERHHCPDEYKNWYVSSDYGAKCVFAKI